MGKVLLVWRLVKNNIRHRRTQTLLLLIAIAAAATTLTLGLGLRGATSNPFTRTKAATNGPDVVATLMPGGGPARTPAHPDSLVVLEHARGVAAYSGPFPVTWTTVSRASRSLVGAAIEGGSSASSNVDQPKLLHGNWVRPGGVVVEEGFADALGLQVGDPLSLGGRTFTVAGIAVTAAIPDYPQVCAFSCLLTIGHYNPGLIWATATDAQEIAHSATSSPVAYYLNLKLNDPAQAGAFARNFATNAPTEAGSLFLYPAQYIRQADTRVIANVQLFLFTASSLLALLALASVAVLVGGRMSEQIRRVGLLKSVGGTPQLVAVVLLCENALIGLLAAGVGLIIGRLAAPSLTGPGAGLLGAPTPVAVTSSTIAMVIALALGVAVAATFVPAIRSARQNTVAALDDSARKPQRRPSMITFAAHLPVPLLLGSRLAIRRPRRLLLNLCSVAVTVSGLVALLILRSTEANPEFLAPTNPLQDRLGDAIVIISIVLFALAAINAVFIAWTTILETRQASALARALGATPQQLTTGLIVGVQVLPSLIGSLLGIPLGIGIYYAFTPHSGTTTMPSGFWFALIAVATPIIIGFLTAIPTRLGTRQPVAQLLNTT